MDTFVGGKDVPSYYANAVRTVVSVYDITLIVGQIGFREDGEAEMRETVRLNLSPQHAKALAAVLTRNVLSYEEQFGVIQLPGVETTNGSPSEPEQPS